MPKTTPEKKLTVASVDLAKVLQSKKPILLPDDPLRSIIDKPCEVFEASVQDTIVKKPKQLITDSTVSLNLQAPVTPPRVRDETNHVPIDSKNEIKSTEPSPRVEDIPTVPCKVLSPRVKHNAKLYDAQSSRPKQHETPSFHAMQPIHRRPNRLQVSKSTSSMQLEENQLKNNDPVIIHLDSA